MGRRPSGAMGNSGYPCLGKPGLTGGDEPTRLYIPRTVYTGAR
jgi:hypothetical protein